MVNELIRIIREISAKADTLSIGELAEYIHREPSTMVRIVAIANSLGFNPSGVQITSVHQAIVAVGFERLRNLAISLLLLDQAQSPFTAAANRELASLALLSGLFAANLSRRRLWVDRDLAFVCGALRDYGRMLMATFLPEEYSTLAREAGNDFTDDACRSVLGLTPLQLGHDILSLMELPETITGTLARVPPELRRLPSENPKVALPVIAD
jgi:HD-like signal output (HDOD) protein